MMDEICRECITCDGGCGRTDPSNKCARCHLTYYCSKKCQKKHWKEHREDCRDVNGMWRLAFPTACTTPQEATNTDCAICLSETIVNPLVLDCRHAFCFSCLSKYQERTSKYRHRFQCPLCRNPNAQDAPLDHIVLLVSRAHKMEPGWEEEREHRFQEALDLLAKAMESDANDLRMLNLQAEILLLKGDPDQAVDVLHTLFVLNRQGAEYARVLTEKLDRHDELSFAGRDDEAEQLLKEIQVYNQTHDVTCTNEIEIQLLLAQAHEAKSDWDAAVDVYVGMSDFYGGPSKDVRQRELQRKLFMCISEAFYNTGDYDKAIDGGDSAIEMNRQFPGVHKYVALSHKRKGNLEEAQTVMNRAVLYETPWDDSNRQQNYDLWKDLVASTDS